MNSHSVDQHAPSPIAPNAAMSPPVSAIVVTYYTGPILARTVASLKTQAEIEEIIIVDNGNWDDAVINAADCGDDEGPRVEIVSGHGNIGFSAGCNMGAAIASSPFLLFLNPDAILPRDAVGQLLRDGAQQEAPWMIGAKLVDTQGIEQVGSRRATLTPWRAFVETLKLYKFAPRHPYFRRFNMHADPCPGEVIPVPVTSGACFLISKQDFDLIDGFDEKYFLHVEDIDFCLRFNKAGGTVYYDPKVAVTHFKGSSRANRIGIEFHKTRGMQLYFARHFSEDYPKAFLWLVDGFLWLRFAGYSALKSLHHVLSLAGLRQKRGRYAMVRGRAIAARRSARR